MRAAGIVLGLALAAGAPAPATQAPATPSAPVRPATLSPRALWEAWPAARFVPTAAPCLHPAELAERLRDLAARNPELRVDEVGRSIEERPIFRMSFGSGSDTVLLWSQMHGDEPSATPALLDLADFLLARRGDPEVERLLSRLTLVMVPMLNPDGAEAYVRRNAQAIDLNRDALNLVTAEGQLLKRLRDEHRPILGFNLHDQNRRRTLGTRRVLAAGAVLAVVGDAGRTVTPGRLRAMRAGAAVAAALAPFTPGGLARFDDAWSPRSFGDNLTAWGTPVLLIESGGVPEGQSLAELTRLNFVGLGAALGALAADDLAGFDPTAYAALPENTADEWADVALRGGAVRQPGSPGAYRADLTFNRLESDREREGCGPQLPDRIPRSEIVELGDARIFGAAREVDATGRVLLAPFVVGAKGWRARRFLDAPGLERLARLGVAEGRWAVPARRLDAALRLVESTRGTGRPRLTVTTDESGLPPVVLRQRPQLPTGSTLDARLRALETAAGRPAGGDEASRLAALWGGARRAPLRPETPASFLVVAPAGDDLFAGVVERLFLEGVELPGEFR